MHVLKKKTVLLPPAYVVRREGNSFTLFVSSHLRGGYPYSILLCNISQNAMGQPLGGGVPCQVQLGGYPGQGGTLPGGTLAGGVPWLGGYPGMGGTLAGGVPWWGGTQVRYPPARSGWGGTQLGQHREYLLHGGRYVSCVHAGGLSC